MKTDASQITYNSAKLKGWNEHKSSSELSEDAIFNRNMDSVGPQDEWILPMPESARFITSTIT